MTNDQIRAGMRRLKGQISTPVGFPRDIREAIVERGLMRFLEWPSGHWSVTDKGRNWLMNNPSEEDGR